MIVVQGTNQITGELGPSLQYHKLYKIRPRQVEGHITLQIWRLRRSCIVIVPKSGSSLPSIIPQALGNNAITSSSEIESLCGALPSMAASCPPTYIAVGEQDSRQVIQETKWGLIVHKAIHCLKKGRHGGRAGAGSKTRHRPKREPLKINAWPPWSSLRQAEKD